MNDRITGTRAAWVVGLLATVAAACGGSASRTGTTPSASSTSALAAAYASTSDSTGTLLCAPAQGQIDACATLAAGDACTLTTPEGESVAGTCRTTLDGQTVACAPNPPAPPAALVAPCASLAAGDACTVADPLGADRTGVCVTGRDGVTLVCGRVRSPPQFAVDACATLASGDACTMTFPEGKTVTGVCSMGPASTGPLACVPSQELLPHGAAACAGLAAGAACTMGRDDDEASGTCVTPAAGGDPVCVVACGDLGGPFRCREGGAGMGPGGMPWPGRRD